MRDRQIDHIAAIPPLGPGFAGDQHRAALVIAPGNLTVTDPFFLMADDQATSAGPFGEAHPHAGLETVTFMLSGFMEDGAGRVEEGDVEWMTAGSGIVHNKDTAVSAGMRLFQLWLLLPEGDRNMDPRVQLLKRDQMPVRREPGVEARVYSGRSGEAVSATLNAVPVTLVDVHLQPGAVFEQDLPADYNGFVVGLDGETLVGDRASVISVGAIGWAYPLATPGQSRLRLAGGASGGRVLLYAGLPQNISVVARGPFIAGSPQELDGLFRRYRQGAFPQAEQLPA